MNVLPVITREFRSLARQRFTFTLRELGVFAMLVAGIVFVAGHPLVARSGGELFAHLHRTLFFAIWVLVPFSVADCISRERREGTLGLLFLTALKPTDIVIAKGLVHGLRALTLLVAVLPVMTIPFLLGGITWQQAVLSALINFSAILCALAAALVASAVSRRGLRAVVGATALGVVALLAFAYVLGFFISGGITQVIGRRMMADDTWIQGLAIAGVSPRHWQELMNFFPAMQVLRGAGQAAAVAVLALAAAVWLAANRIRRNWREEPPPAWVQWSERVFCTPVLWLSFFRWWMRRKLDRNPIGWLEQRRWTGRLVAWSWFAVVISLYSLALTDSNFIRNFKAFQVFLAWLLVGSIAASAAGSFRRERESGVLELLLVAPLTTNQIIAGRLRGLWGQFLPSMGLLLGVWLYFAGLFGQTGYAQEFTFFGITFLTLPVIGLYFSVRCQSFISAFLFTLGAGLLVPFLMSWPMALILAEWGFSERLLVPAYGFSLAQMILAAVFGMKLRWRLQTRSFPFERTALS